MLEKALKPSTFTTPAPVTMPHVQPSSPSGASPHKTVSVERPVLLSSATSADVTAWEEAWDDYSQCQQLQHQSRETRVAAIRQALDEDLRRYIREGTIELPTNPDARAYIDAVKAFIRRQRNPLLDRLDFYSRVQRKGETFDEFLTSLKEIWKACAFNGNVLCDDCTSTLCRTCHNVLQRVNDEKLRDRIVVGVLDDETRHKLLAEKELALDDAVRICRAEEAATHTRSSITTPGTVNAARKSAYKRQQHAQQKAAVSVPKPAEQRQCPNCGRKAHNHPSSCPAAGRVCNGCGGVGHFQRFCKQKKVIQPTTKRNRQLKLFRTSQSEPVKIDVKTRLATEKTPSTLAWLPDTGSDVDAIGPQHLSSIDGFVENLDEDSDTVLTANGDQLESVGKIRAELTVGSSTCETIVHVYDGLSDALLSRTSLRSLGFLPPDWPAQVCSTTMSGQPGPKRPDAAELARIRESLLLEFSDVFNDDELQAMHGPPMSILLADDAVPHRVNGARAIPFAYRDGIKRQLDGMVSDGIIEPVTEPTEWCHPIVVVAKKNSSEKRLTVDLRKLNDQVRRPTYPTTTPRAALSAIGTSNYFTTFDARHGYWQVPLAEESKSLTTFITPWGRFRYCRNPQGLISAGDEFNRRTDAALADLPNLVKVVDDCLVHDTSFDEHLHHVRAVLQRAREHGITFSAKKFSFGAEQVPFCGYTVSSTGWTLDEAKTNAIRDFPEPCNRTDLRSFLGLINQFGAFTERLSELCTPLRPLLKPSVEFAWDATHRAAFNAVKTALVSPPVLAHFDLGRPLRLETDASVLHGLGYALWQQQDDNQWRLLECGSRFLSDAESRYAVIELECLAVVWAVKKCHLFLQGGKFSIVTDHRPLIPILNSYSLDQIENPRLQRLVLKLRSYQLHASWRKGAENAFADALSRYPVQQPTFDDELGEDPSLSAPSVRACLRQDDSGRSSNLRLYELREAAYADREYQALLDLVLTGFPRRLRNLPAQFRPYWTVRHHLSVDNGLVLKGQRLVIPSALRRSVLDDLHASHQGMTRTKQRARQLVFWPQLTTDIENVVRSCAACRERAPSQTNEPLRVTEDRQPTLPFESTSADLFSCQGLDFLVYTDRKTGWPCVAKMGRSSSSSDVIRAFRRWFADLGAPTTLCTDGGSQFSSRKFKDFCERWHVRHVMSSPHYPRSNGHAEAAVKSMKSLISKTTRNGNLDVDAFQRGLLEWRNTPAACGRSPAQQLFGRPLSSFLPAHHRSFAPEWQIAADTADAASREAHEQNRAVHDRHARPLKDITLGSRVDVQDPRTKLWSSSGIVVAVGKNRDYDVKLPSGRVYRRNRRFLRPVVPALPPSPSNTSSPSIAVSAPSSPPRPRRSRRQRRPPRRLDIASTHGQSYD